MDKIKELKEQAASLSLYNTRDKIEDLIHQAEQEESSYTLFLGSIFSGELKYRHDKAQARRIKDAGFPYPKHL